MRFINLVYRANTLVAVFLFAALTMVVALQVLTRFVLHLPMIWSEELGRFLFFWVVMLGAAMSVRNRRHFVIDVISAHRARLGRAGRLVFDVIPDLCIVAFCVVLLVQGISYVQMGALRTATNSQINMALIYAAIPVFAGLSVIYAGSNLLIDVAAFRRGQPAVPLETPSAE